MRDATTPQGAREYVDGIAVELSPGSEIVRREFDYGEIVFENLNAGDWLTQKGEPAKKPRRRYTLAGREVCSPSQLVGNLDKPALVRWIERESVIGAVYAERAGELHGVPEEDWPWRVQSLRLGASAKRDIGAERGTVVHEALHILATEGRVPDPSMVADYARPWVQAAVLAWEALDIRQVLEAEQIVGHPELGFAGRFDLFAMCGPDKALTLIDWKTSPKGRVHPESHWQARAYAMAIERSLETSVEAIKLIGVGAEGGFELIDCEIAADDLKALIHVHYARKRVEAAQRTQRRLTGAAA